MLPSHRDLPLALLAAAYFSTGGEAAWSHEHALEVIDWARDEDMAVLGGEIWLPTNPGPTIPTPYIYTWSVIRDANERWHDFVLRAGHESADWISQFRWADEDSAHRSIEPFFNFVIVSESE